MLPEERRRTIVDTVREADGCSVSELAGELDVSEATIRRDLRELADEGLLERSHGGAVPVRTVATEPSYSERDVTKNESKRAIGRRAADEVTDGEVVFFDSGSTTIQAARELSPESSCIAATNFPPAALELVDRAEEVKLTGGTLRPQTRALVGPTGEAFLDRTNFDLLFLGTNALHPEAGLTTPNEDEARMKQRMCEKAQRVVLLSDSSKFGRRSFVQFADFDDLDMLITDGPVPDAIREELAAADVRVFEVSP